MKKVLHVMVAGLVLGLAGCGGSSDSSSYEGKREFANGSKWLCPAKNAYDNCTSDETCAKTACLQTVKPKVETAPAGSGGTCVPVDGKVLLAEGQSCSISVPNFNNGQVQYPTCSGGRISTGFINSKTLTLNNITIACK